MTTPAQTLAKIERMTDGEGILTIKGHGFGPEVTLSLPWDRMGQPLYQCQPTLAEMIDAIHEEWCAAMPDRAYSEQWLPQVPGDDEP